MDEKKLSKTVGSVMALRRKQLGLSQEKMAELIGIGQESLSRMEKGSIAPKFERLQAIAAALQCSVADLFRNQDDDLQAKAATIADLLVGLSSEKQGAIIRIIAEIARLGKEKA